MSIVCDYENSLYETYLNNVWYDKTDATVSGYKTRENIVLKMDYAADTAIATNTTWGEYLDTGTTSTTIYKSKIYWNTYDHIWKQPVVAPDIRMRQIIQTRMAPAFHHSRTSMSIAMDVREERARQTLRRIIGDQAYRKFVRNGFITVVPKSGLTYRIYPGCGITDVYDRGIMVDRLCVVLKGNFPPTDSLLMRYLLILNDEGEFSKYAIKHYVSQDIKKLVFPTEEVKPLTETWAELKVA